MDEERCPTCHHFWLYCTCQLDHDEEKLMERWMSEFREMVGYMKEFTVVLRDYTKTLKEFKDELKKNDKSE